MGNAISQNSNFSIKLNKFHLPPIITKIKQNIRQYCECVRICASIVRQDRNPSRQNLKKKNDLLQTLIFPL